MNIDKMSTVDMLNAIQQENLVAVNCISSIVEVISNTVDAIYPKMQKGGRLFYVGCGTSGRLGVLDASEIPPTFGMPHGVVVGVIAGGDRALRFATEGSEDDESMGFIDLEKYDITDLDSVIGISAAGGARYVMGALKCAKDKNALTACITSNEDTAIGKLSDFTIITDTGAEAITGSTRMKAGTAQKLVLNMISTSLMVKLGLIYQNLMINLKPTNQKLKNRMINIVCEILECDREIAEQKLVDANWVIKEAVKG